MTVDPGFMLVVAIFAFLGFVGFALTIISSRSIRTDIDFYLGLQKIDRDQTLALLTTYNERIANIEARINELIRGSKDV